MSSCKYLLTVPGSEGTAGTYVNQHGYIHQTITVKEVFEPHVVCLGEQENRDSWFPGYSWTMVFCSYCHNHLGCKFIPVDERNTVTNTPTSNSGSDLNYQLLMRLQEDKTENEFSHKTVALKNMDANRERHERSMWAGSTSNKLPYFWGLSRSSVVCSQVSETNQDIAKTFGSVEDGEGNDVQRWNQVTQQTSHLLTSKWKQTRCHRIWSTLSATQLSTSKKQYWIFQAGIRVASVICGKVPNTSWEEYWFIFARAPIKGNTQHRLKLMKKITWSWSYEWVVGWAREGWGIVAYFQE